MIDKLTEIIERRLAQVNQKITRAALSSGRSPSEISLLVVSKSQPIEVIEAAISAGVRRFGENYPEETLSKLIELKSQVEIEWHMIGHLQSRKARIVTEHFQMLHSLDSYPLAEKLDRLLAESGKKMPALLEFNVGGEESKFGWAAWDETRWKELLPELSRILVMEHLHITGLMTMPPLSEDVEESRPFFQKLHALRDFLAASFPGTKLTELSMGTSADFEIAIEEGATMIRVGRAILGDRPPKNTEVRYQDR
jgi:pyridoxal phosphate enzyme (YggS family)